MELLMFIDGRYISSLTVNPYQYHIPGYLTYLKQELIDLHFDTVEAAEEDPQFFIEGVPSSMNFFSSFNIDDLINNTLYPRNNNKNKE